MSEPIARAASPEGLDIDPNALEALFAKTQKVVSRYPLCAAQVAVARHGRLAAFRAFGSARCGGVEREVSEDTLFAIYSCTKAVVSAASWILIQRGKLALEDPVARHIPEFARHGKQGVTIEHLLTHTAGFPSERLQRKDWLDPVLRIERFADWRLEWEPGTRFTYHGDSTMWLLAELITRLSGLDYRDFVRERIFEPLGLSNFYIGLPRQEHPRVADVVQVGEAPTDEQRAGSPVDAPVMDQGLIDLGNLPENREIGGAGGGGIATAADLALFYQGLLADAQDRGEGIWQPAMLADAWTPRFVDLIDPMTKQKAMRGLGVVIAGEEGSFWRGIPESCSARSFGHMGAGGQVAWADPESGLSFAFCTNGAESNAARQGARGLQLSSLAAACAK